MYAIGICDPSPIHSIEARRKHDTDALSPLHL